MVDFPFGLESPPIEVDFAFPSPLPEDTEFLAALKASVEKAGIPESVSSNEDLLGLPKIQGHQLTATEWKAFEEYVQNPNRLEDVAVAAGITRKQLYKYRKEAWWKHLFAEHVTQRQQDLHAGLMTLTKDALIAVEDILQGNLDPEKEGKYANAMMKAVDLLTKTGEKPLQDNRSITNIDNRQLINTGTVHLTREKLETLDQDDMLKMITGEVKIEG